VRIVCISDTHLRKAEVPDGDVLVHAGDFTMRGHLLEVESFNRWLERWPHPHKVVIAGNHDFAFEKRPAEARRTLTAATYIEDELLEVAGLRIWGSPWTPKWGEWAFSLERGSEIRAKWELIPEGLDILITHGPPAFICDQAGPGLNVGCEDLREIVEQRKPRLHVFGHVHEGYGVLEKPHTTYVNASAVTAGYHPGNKPIVIDL
jgi:Icc-related predicted phosphoesterase